MTGDRDLDAYIAEHFMGWFWVNALGKTYLVPPFAKSQMVDFNPHHWKVGKVGEVSSLGTYYTGYDHMALPHYSSVPAACSQLKARLRELGLNYSIDFLQGGGFAVTGTLAERLPIGNENQAIAYDEEEAVCKFARALKESGAL